MVELNLQSIDLKEAHRLRWNIGGMLAKNSEDLPKDWEKFTLLAHKLLLALVSDDIESIADHLAVSCETLDDLRLLMYNAGCLMHELGERLNATRE